MPVLLKSIPCKNKVWEGLSSFPDVKTEAQGRQSFAKQSFAKDSHLPKPWGTLGSKSCVQETGEGPRILF